MAKKTGRPPSLTPESEKRLLELVAQGATYREACRKLKINRDALLKKRMDTRDPFFVQSARATLLGTEANLEMAEERLKKSTNRRISVDRELAHHYRWKASKLLVAYKDKIEVKLDAVPAQTWRDTPVAEWGDAEKLEAMRATCWALARLGLDLDRWGHHRLSEAVAMLGGVVMEEMGGKKKKQPQQLLAAPVRGNSNPFPASEGTDLAQPEGGRTIEHEHQGSPAEHGWRKR